MQHTLEEFLRALRAAEVLVSPAEAIDAHKAVAQVGYQDRQLLKDALCATLAKGEDEVVRFDRTFDTFFSRPAFTPRRKDSTPPKQQPQLPEAEGSRLVEMLLSDDGSGLSQAMEEAARETRVTDIRLSTQRSRVTRRMLGAMGFDEIEQAINAARGRGDAPGEELAEQLEEGRRALLAEATRYVGRQQELFAADGGKLSREEVLAKKALDAMDLDAHDIAAMQAMVRKMAKRLAERYSRRRRKAKKGDLDVRRTLQRSMAFGGIPFVPMWKYEKQDRPEIVVICDVSNSVAAAAKFLLTLLYSLNEAVERMDAFAFSSRLISVNDVLKDNTVEQAIVEVLKRIAFQQTNYGQALQDFCDQHLHEVNRHTTVIILGDGRTNFIDPRMDLMQMIQQRSRAVIWLNPEDESRWGSGDSVMHRYARFCHVAKTCNSLGQLERIVEDVLRSYSPR
ncbi:MAG: VWA domain-containing protein [Phenylobacterium sp.]|uniref:vWA domain-containing protein n=1 Tax=Phenylobacterium sp. TaxID=1871053 RepID=UPI002735FB1C|nr:VWA domain-containing protein [Phenylobacterium sp.]MDP3175486.1 VWA domain-containing protein [Phenylobacterium sp.]